MEKLKKVRAEFWQMDIVLPDFGICAIAEEKDFNCVVRIGGNEIFKEKILYNKPRNTADEKIISEIRSYFLKNETKSMIDENLDVGDKNE